MQSYLCQGYGWILVLNVTFVPLFLTFSYYCLLLFTKLITFVITFKYLVIPMISAVMDLDICKPQLLAFHIAVAQCKLLSLFMW